MHIWDNGDVDCVVTAVESHYPVGAVLFSGHDPAWNFEVATTIGAWLEALLEEHLTYGDIYDPWTCHTTGSNRLYARK